jgi:hypothetical protein
MAAIQPKNTDEIHVNIIKEKTAATGVEVQDIVTFTTAMLPMTAVVDAGSSTAAEHFREAFIKTISSNGQAMELGTDSAHALNLKTTALTRFSLTSAGDLDQDLTNGGSVTLTKASTCVVPGTTGTGLTAAGTLISDALDLTAVFNNVTTTAAATGVQLWDAPLHSMIFVRNAGANALAVYPHSALGTINGGGGGASVAVAAATLNIFWRTSTTAWIGVEFAVAAA